MNLPHIAQIAHVEKMTGFHRSTLRRWWVEGKFPAPQKLNGTTLAWHSDEIDSWINQTVINGKKETLYLCNLSLMGFKLDRGKHIVKIQFTDNKVLAAFYVHLFAWVLFINYIFFLLLKRKRI